MNWQASELRITDQQAEFLRNGKVSHWSTPLAQRTEDSLSGRRMLIWVRGPDGRSYRLAANLKGKAALAHYQKLRAANDNQNQGEIDDAA